MAEFAVAVASNNQVSRRALTTAVQLVSRISFEQQASKVYRAREKVIIANAGNYQASFEKLPALLRELSVANPGSTIVLENDQEGRFFRAFVCFAGSMKALPNCQSVFGFDGAHFKQSKYTGKALVLLARDGNNQSFPVAFALVSSENEANVSWFIDLSIEAGVPPGMPSTHGNPPLFCNRGVLLNVAASLEEEKGIILNLRYCTIHIMRNINRNFGARGKKLESCVWAVQGATTADAYTAAIAKLKADFGEEVSTYVANIPPSRWTVHGTDTKLYGWRTTNFVESHNAVLDRNGVRRDSPFQALQLAAKQAMTSISSRGTLHRQWLAKSRTLTPFASSWLQEQQADAGAYEWPPAPVLCTS